MKFARVLAIAALAYLAVVVGVAVVSLQPPPALPVTAPADRFSAERAFRHLARAFTEPHPAGTPAHRRVFEYLLSTLREIGAEPNIQETTSVRVLPGERPRPGTNVANVRNLVARLPGTVPGKALLFVAHYDSVIWGPGAADDGSGCAVLIETLRALKAGPALRNDVIFLFADAEESGLMGAYAFAREHPWMHDVALVFNFDVRGVAGPSYMFETGRDNLGLIPHFVQACSCPLANSLMPSIYYRTGLNSDFTVFRRLGLSGLNFAFIRGIAYYHTANDRPENLDLRSLQHQGNYALELARYFGNLPLEDFPAGQAIYFNPAGCWLVSYPASWAAPLAAVTMAWLCGLILLGLRRGRVRASGVLKGALGYLACVTAATGAVSAGAMLAWRWRRYYMVYDEPLYLAAAASVVVLVFSVCLGRLLRAVTWREAFLGASCVWAAGLAVSVFALPVASFVFQWPLAFVLLALTAELAAPQSAVGVALRLAAHAIGAAGHLLFAIPAAIILHDGITAVLVPITAFWLALVLGLLIPWLAAVRAAAPRLLPVLSAAAAAATIAAIVVRGASGPTSERPETLSLSYVLNAETGQAYWVSRAREPNRFEQWFFPPDAERGPIQEFRPADRESYLKRPAVATFPEPLEFSVVSDTRTGRTRRVVLRLRSLNGAQRVQLHLPPEAEVLASRVNGKPYAAGRGWWLEYHGFGEKEAELEMELPTGVPPKLTVIEYIPGLPALPGPSPAQLPSGWILEPNTTGWGRGLRSGWTLVRRTFDLGQ
ncbi:MAG: M20/M25/M40 family metallo-hydrolase [Bryobacterales bacterium]|nr:M20/M25/M40 family metallo-hydrolase [Bryobacteraceae bacterium]MDW8129840.1 M20/M25/M40 family metallo-hydrolase [Bryobacterales bacterium]